MNRLYVYLLILVGLCWSMVGCSDGKIFKGDRIEPNTTLVTTQPKVTSNLTEVAPPTLITQLERNLSYYEPQVKIISPQANEIKSDINIEVQLQVEDLPVHQDLDLKLGPHLRLILDNQPYQEIYDLEKPIVLENLLPGTHTVRVFAVRPWGESFKNEGAYAQTTFHILTKTNSNNPDPNLPLLTYNVPQGIYGAEPILLDFYLNNAPLHLAAQQNIEDKIEDWRIKVTINGESFILDTWQSIYLKGFKTGKNWVQLEFIDENGENIDNVFNNTVRLLDYDPNYQDGLADLVAGKIPLEQAKKIVIAEPSPLIEPAKEEVEVEEQVPEILEELLPEVEETEEEQAPETLIEIKPEPSNTEVEIIEPLNTNEEAEELESETTNKPINNTSTQTEEQSNLSIQPEVGINNTSETNEMLVEENIADQEPVEIPEIVTTPKEPKEIIVDQEPVEIPEIVTLPKEPKVEIKISDEVQETQVEVKNIQEPQSDVNLSDTKSEQPSSLIEKIQMWIQSLVSRLLPS